MSSFPRSFLPMLPVVAAEPFDSPHHLYELKWAGVRALAFIEGARLRLQSLSGREISGWFPELASLVGQVGGRDTVLDGEIIAPGPDGAPDHGLLSRRLSAPGASGAACVYQAYDLLYHEGGALLDQPLIARKERLVRALRGPGPAAVSAYVDHDGMDYFQAVVARRLPGIVAKERDSGYRPGQQSDAWQEIRAYESGWFLIGGYTLGVRKEAPVRTLLLGEPTPRGRLRFVAQVEATLPGVDFERVVEPLTTAISPFQGQPDVPRLVYWLEPTLACEVNFASRDAEGRLRFPVLVTLRPDLSPAECRSALTVAVPAPPHG